MDKSLTISLSALLLLTGLAIPAAATRPQGVTILVTKPLDVANPGTFVATGGITDSGVFQQSDFHEAAIPSPQVGSEHYTDTFTGANGTTWPMSTPCSPSSPPGRSSPRMDHGSSPVARAPTRTSMVRARCTRSSTCLGGW